MPVLKILEKRLDVGGAVGGVAEAGAGAGAEAAAAGGGAAATAAQAGGGAAATAASAAGNAPGGIADKVGEQVANQAEKQMTKMFEEFWGTYGSIITGVFVAFAAVILLSILYCIYKAVRGRQRSDISYAGSGRGDPGRPASQAQAPYTEKPYGTGRYSHATS